MNAIIALNTEVAFGLYGRHLENSILRHNSAGDRLIEAKFSMLMHNHMPMTRDARIPLFNIRILSVSVKNYPYPYPIRSDVVNCYPYPIYIRSINCESKKFPPTFSTVASTLVVRI